MFLQGLPGSIPWGVYSSYLHDILANEKKFSADSVLFSLSLLTSRRRRCSSSSGSARPSGTCSRAWSAGSSTASIGRISRSPSRSAISSACHYSPFSSRPLSPRASPSPCPSSSTRCFSPCSACCSTSPDRRSKASCSTSIARSAEEPPRLSGRCSITPGESWGRSCLRRC